MIAKIEALTLPAFALAGLTVRTTNQNGQSQKDIGVLWQHFMAEGIMVKIDGRLSDDIYCVYTDYESDHTGYYTTLIGCKVNSVNELADGLTGITIPEGKYQVYTLAGKFPDKVHMAWKEIWNSDINRAYTADFDLYHANAKSFEETEVEIYLALK